MKLQDLDHKNVAKKALEENFKFDLDTSKLDLGATKSMLLKVRGLIKSVKSSSNFYESQNNSSYLKLVFMEEALSKHLKTIPSRRIVVENEEVEKSQVILAAQDMVDSVQKMVEEVNDMLVKELPALTNSIQSEIGAVESGSFNGAASQALTNLNQTLSQTRTELQNALNGLTGVGTVGDAFNAPAVAGDMAVTDIGDAGNGEEEISGEEEIDVELPAEEPELPTPKVGREKR